MPLKFDNRLARKCGRYVRNRAKALRAMKEPGPDRVVELEVLERIAGFPFEKYPDWSVPWHLIQWNPKSVRWQFVADVLYVMESLKQPTGSAAGQPMVMQPFQSMVVMCFLGPTDPKTGFRLVTEGLLTLARKNAKTTTIAALVVALMSLDPVETRLFAQEIQVGASDKEQAGIMYGMAERFIQLDRDLNLMGAFHPTPHKKLMRHVRTLSTFKCLSSDVHRQHGGNPAIVLIDEIGNIPDTQARKFYSVLTSGDGAQNEFLPIMLSTQADSDTHIFSQQVDKGKRVNEGMLNDNTFAAFVFSVPELDDDEKETDPFDESLWHLANPGLGTIVSWKSLRTWAKKAKDMPSLEQQFRLLKLNQRVSDSAPLFSRTVWEQNTGRLYELDELKGRECYLGIDLSETTDLSSLAALFEPIDESGRFPIRMNYWIPGNDLRGRSDRDKVDYSQWSARGLIDTQSDRVVDYARIAEQVIWFLENTLVKGIGFDLYKMKYLRKALADLGYTWPEDDLLPGQEFLIEIRQGYITQDRTVTVLEELAVNRLLSHGGHPILRWNAANTVVTRDAALNRKFNKIKSYGRTDGIVALGLAAHARDHKRLVGDFVSVYEDPDRKVIM